MTGPTCIIGTADGVDEATAVAPGKANAVRDAKATDDDTSPSFRNTGSPFLSHATNLSHW